MGQWYVKYVDMIYRGHVKCIMDGNKVVMEVENYTTEFTNNLVEIQRESESKAYEKGMYAGIEIMRDNLREDMKKDSQRYTKKMKDYIMKGDEE